MAILLSQDENGNELVKVYADKGNVYVVPKSDNTVIIKSTKPSLKK